MKDYIIQDLTYIKNNKNKFIEGAILAHKRFVFAYGVPFNKMSSTWFYRYYNLSTLTFGCPFYYKFFMDLQKIIRKTAGHNKPLWYQCWLNFHKQEEVLDWHDHQDCSFHGYVSIDPKDTETQFEKFTIKNKVGKLYMGPANYKHKVNVLSGFKGERITIAFDVCSVQDRKNSLKKNNNNEIDVNTGFIPLPK